MKIEIYTIDGCFYCEKIKELMQRANLPYTLYKAYEDITIEEIQEKYPLAQGFPYTVIDDSPIGGLVPTTKYLIEKGIVSSKKTE